MKILVLNSGSSSLKSSLYDLPVPLPSVPPDPLWQGEVEWAGSEAEIKISTSSGRTSQQGVKVSSRQEATRQLLATLWTGPTRVIKSAKDIQTVGHRVVNGGPDCREPVILDAKVKAAIEAAVVFAPLHNQAELDGIAIAEKEIPGVPQVAVFDTGFHRHMPEAACVYPGPYDWLAQGIRRYGFHGINHAYCAERATQILKRDPRGLRIVSCHLGNGCSLAAIEDGRSVDTTMGFTPLEGLMMGTRSGSVDPGILTYLMRQKKQTGEQLDDLLNKKSGLSGISGFSGDMREIIEAMKTAADAGAQQTAAIPGAAAQFATGNSKASGSTQAARAKLAFDMFVHRLRREIGSMTAVLGGLDVLVFTAGIGENSADIRAAACAPLAFAGVQLDLTKNAQSPADADISATTSTVRVLIIAAQEDWMIARDCFRLTT
jgi:acetate kinase